MKKLVIIAIIALTSIGFAQRPENARMQDAINKRDKLAPKDKAELQSKRMQLSLDLSDAQQNKVENILLKHFETQKEKRDAFIKSEKRPTPEERTKMQNERLDHLIALKAEMKTVLNAEQYEKFSKAFNRKMQKKKNKKRGRRGDRKRK